MVGQLSHLAQGTTRLQLSPQRNWPGLYISNLTLQLDRRQAFLFLIQRGELSACGSAAQRLFPLKRYNYRSAYAYGLIVLPF